MNLQARWNKKFKRFVLCFGTVFTMASCHFNAFLKTKAMLSNESVATVIQGQDNLTYITNNRTQIQPNFATSLTQESNVMLYFILVALCMLVCFILWKHISSQKKLKQELSQDFQGMKNILNTLPMPLFIIDKDRSILNINKAAEKVFGVDEKLVKGKCCKCLSTNICGTKNCALEKLFKEHTNTTLLDIENSHYLVITTPFTDQAGKVEGYLEVLQDVSELVNTQRDLEARTLELKTISENLFCGVLITSLDQGFIVLQCNQGYLDLLGCKEQDVLGKPAITWLLKEESGNLADRIFEQLKTEGSVQLEHLLQNANGHEIWVSLFGRQTKLHNRDVGVWMLVNIDDQKRSEQNVKINEERYRIAIENTEDIIIDYDIEKDVMIHNDRVIEVYGVDTVVVNPKEAIVGSKVIADESIAGYQHIFEDLKQGKEKVGCDLLTHAKDGREIWCRLNFTTIFNEAKKPIRAVGVLHDITKEKRAILDYQREASYRKLTMDDITIYYEANLTKRVFLTGHEKLIQTYLSKPTNDFDVVRNIILEHLVARVDREKVQNIFSCENLFEEYQKGETKIEFEYQRILAKKECGWVRCTLYMIADESTKDVKMLCYVKDIDESKKLEIYLKKQAEIDLLTGLYNKITTEMIIKESVKQLRNGQSAAFFIIDLDDFKLINDSLGHAFGDAVLSEVSQRLKQWFKEEDVIGRIGGDEFVVFLNNITKANAIEQASSVCNLFRSMYTGVNDNYKVSGSVGVSFAPSDGTTFDELYHKADIALYTAKNSGKDNYSIYEASLPQRMSSLTTRRIDANAGKLFAGNIGEYVLKILYEAKQPKVVVNAVLELVAKQFRYSRGYIFEHFEEGDYWINTFEWCASGIPNQKDNLQRVKFSEPGYFESLYNEQGEYIIYDMSEVEGEVYELVKPMHLTSFAQFAVVQNGFMKAFVGFDNWERQWVPGKEDLEVLHTVVMLLDVFVLRNK